MDARYEIADITFLPGLCNGKARFEVIHRDGFNLVTLSEKDVEDFRLMLAQVVPHAHHPFAQLLREMERAHVYFARTNARDPVRDIRRKDDPAKGSEGGTIQTQTGLPYSMEP